MLGQYALGVLGIRAQLILGSMIYRAGPNPLYDTLTYTSAADNTGFFKNEGTFFEPITEAGSHARFAGHCWLEYDDQLVDFSVGDWHEHFDELRANLRGESTRPINWTAPPPAFFWSDAAAFKQPWKPTGAPPLGVAWYGPLRIRRDTESAVRAQVANVEAGVLNTVRPALPLLKRNMMALGLLERMRPYAHQDLRKAGAAI
jgi:hypothetical protein